MALSQVQCLDNNNVNWRSSESKPEFFYSEEQRLALEALVSKGADAFHEVLKKENIREFLSELELKKILERVEPFDPGSDEGNKGHGGDEEDEEEMSLQYWPQRSDHSIPELDLGWPDTVAYRGVTRATVYMQPPMEGQAHIKEVVRKMVTSAQKVIAVVMDMFTDVDIFKDMLDAGFKKRVAIYIILDESNVQYFLQMCQRAQMHEGHLKNLRVQCIGGTEFHTRFSTKFKGTLAQKFIFVDGDKATCGSYSFTWSAARTDRNVITVLTGQVVETFDKQFQELYLMSKAVSLKGVDIAPEPEPEPVAQPAAVPTDTNIAKIIINPKYALVKAKSSLEVGAASSGKQSGSKEGTKLKSKAREQQHEVKEPFVHPALQNMEKVNMFNYLPTWVEPEPEPGNEILGYINIIDPNIKNAQLSQMNRIKICDTSHATAQHMMMLQNRDQEAKQKQLQDDGKAEVAPKPAEEAGVVQECVKEDRVVESETREKDVQQPVKQEEGPDPVEDQGSAELVETPEVKTPETSAGVFALLADSQHLLSIENEEQHRQVVGKGPPPPIPKPRTVPVKDFISKTNTLGKGQAKVRGEQTDTSNSRAGAPNNSPKEVGTPNGTHQLNSQEAQESTKELDASATQNGLVDNEDDEEYISLSDQGSSSEGSTHANQCPSNTSSNSEDYNDQHGFYPSQPIRRTNSDLVPNGEPVHLHRQMSDGHISRGTFVSPLMDAKSFLAANGRRRNQALEEEIRRAVRRSQKLTTGPQRNERIHTSDADQGKSFFQYRSRAPGSTSNREGFHDNQQETHPRLGRLRMDAANETDAYRRAGKRPGPAAGEHTYWTSQDFGHPRTGSPHHRHSTGPVTGNPSPFPDHQGGPETVNTPFGIPYSKLSESKHLKSRLGGQGDFKRRGHKDH